MESGYKDLGCMNGWSDKARPTEYEDCVRALHGVDEISGKLIGRCLYEYRCEICKIKYTVDSSD